MPQMERTPMNERLQFIAPVEASEESFAVVCRQFEVSLKTGYTWRLAGNAANLLSLMNVLDLTG